MFDELEFFSKKKFDYGDKVKIFLNSIYSAYWSDKGSEYRNQIGTIKDIKVAGLFNSLVYYIEFDNPKCKSDWVYEWYLKKQK